MADAVQWHRQFMRYAPPHFETPPVRRGQMADITPWMLKQYEESHSFAAFMLADNALAPTRMSRKDGQIFPYASTAFERDWSELCGYGNLTPVIDSEYTVVGHVGEVQDGFNHIFVPPGRRAGNMIDILEAGNAVFVAKSNPDAGKFKSHDEGRQTVYRFVTDPDGKVLNLLSSHSIDGVAPPDIDPFLIVGVAQIGAAIGRGIVKALLSKAVSRAGRAVAATFRQAMVKVEQKLIRRGASEQASEIRLLTEEELSRVWGAGPGHPLTDNQLDKAIELLRDGQDVHVQSIGQMRQVQGELGQLGVQSESSSLRIPTRPKFSGSRDQKVDEIVTPRTSAEIVREPMAPPGTGVKEIKGSTRDGRGTYRSDPPHAPDAEDYGPHTEFPHINIRLRNGKKLAVVVTGQKNF